MDLSNRNRFIFASNASCGRTIFPSWIVKGFSGSFQRGNSINQMSVCVLRLNIAVFWATCYQCPDGAENEIRKSAMESWNSWKMAQQRRSQPVWQRHQVLLYGNLSTQQMSTQHNGGHKHTVYIHGFPFMAPDPSPYISHYVTTLQQSQCSPSCLLQIEEECINVVGKVNVCWPKKRPQPK